MVFVNEVKYACQSCIKGHRSSSCHHTDRPLFEIKKKGRPISQCEACRELRKSKRLHVKCCCEERRLPDEEGIVLQSLCPTSGVGKKTVRKIPTIPTLPNGLKDVISRSTMGPAHTKSKITSLLNPCECRDKLTCKCTSASSSSGPAEISPTTSVTARPSQAGPARTDITNQRKQRKEEQNIEPYPMVNRSCCEDIHKRTTGEHSDRTPSTKVAALFTPPSASSSVREFALPRPMSTKFAPLPIFVSPRKPTAPAANATTEPKQEPMEWACQCGAGCQCLGCRQHRGENASDEPEVLCDENCPTCVDSELGPEVPSFLGGTGPVGVRVRHRRAHPHFASGTLLRVAPLAPYEEHAEDGFVDLGWEDAEGSPDPDFVELPLEEHSVGVNVGEGKQKQKQKGGLGLPMELPKLAHQTSPATKNASIVTTSARKHVRGCCARRL